MPHAAVWLQVHQASCLRRNALPAAQAPVTGSRSPTDADGQQGLVHKGSELLELGMSVEDLAAATVQELQAHVTWAQRTGNRLRLAACKLVRAALATRAAGHALCLWMRTAIMCSRDTVIMRLEHTHSYKQRSRGVLRAQKVQQIVFQELNCNEQAISALQLRQ
jgi:hypothetical protein